MKAAKFIALVLGLALLVAVGGAVYLAAYLDRHRDLLTLGVGTALGREVRIEQGVTLHWSMAPTLAIDGLWVGNPDWASGAYLARAGRALLTFDIAALLQRRLAIREVVLQDADILLETGADGRQNWSSGAGHRSDSLVDVRLDALHAEHSTLSFQGTDGTGQRFEIPDVSFERQAASEFALEADLRYRGADVTLSGTTRPAAGGAAAEGAWAFSGQVGLPGLTLAVDGDVTADRSFSRLEVAIQSERLDLHAGRSPWWPALPFGGELRQVSGRLTTSGGALQALLANASGGFDIDSATLAPSAGKGGPSSPFEMKRVHIEVPAGRPLSLRSELGYADRAYQVRLGGGRLADLFPRGKSWDRIQVSATTRFEGKPLEIAGDVGPLSADGVGVDLSVEHDGLKVRADGRLATLDSLRGSRLAIRALAPTLARLTPWLGAPIPDSPPFTLAMHARGSETDLRLTGIRFTTGETDLSGSMRLPIAGDGVVALDLESGTLDLRPFLTGSSGSARSLLPDLEQELPPTALQGMDGSLRLKIRRLRTQDLEMEDVRLGATLDKGHLKLNFAGEGERFTADVDLKPAGASWELALVHKGKLDLGSLIDRELSAEDRSQVPMEVEFSLHGKGRSLGAVLDSADGNFLMVLGAGHLSRRISPRLPLGDVLYALLNVIDKGDGSSRRQDLECAVVQLDFAKGIATSNSGLAVRTGEFNILGGGALKLRSGEIDLHFKTARRRGLGFGSLAISDRLIGISGMLHQPRVAINMGGALAYGAAAWATGGLSVLGDSIIKQLTSRGNPCETVLEAARR